MVVNSRATSSSVGAAAGAAGLKRSHHRSGTAPLRTAFLSIDHATDVLITEAKLAA
jgi:hypothetical protein